MRLFLTKPAYFHYSFPSNSSIIIFPGLSKICLPACIHFSLFFNLYRFFSIFQFVGNLLTCSLFREHFLIPQLLSALLRYLKLALAISLRPLPWWLPSYPWGGPRQTTLPKPCLRTSFALSLLAYFPQQVSWVIGQNTVSTAKAKQGATWQPCQSQGLSLQLISLIQFLPSVVTTLWTQIYFLRILRRESRWTLNFIADGFSILKMVHFDQIRLDQVSDSTIFHVGASLPMNAFEKPD